VKKMLLAVDPGMAGALAWLDDDGRLQRIEDMPVVAKEIQPAVLWNMFRAMTPSAVVIEHQQYMPPQLRGRQQGGGSSFKTGKGFGILLGVVAGLEVPVTTRRSADWKGRLKLSKDKEQSRQRALETWPDHSDWFKLKKHEGRAEAALLGLSMLIEQGKPATVVVGRVASPPRKKLVRVL
jgi:hypothetical protein